MTEWKVETTRGVVGAIGLMLTILLVDVNLIWLAASRPLTIGTFLVSLAVISSLGFLGLLGYWLYGLRRARYLLDRNQLIIQWGATEQIIPTGQIQRVVSGEEVEGQIHFYGGMWPGHWVGYGDLPEIGPALFYATTPPQQQIYIVTPVMTYGISPTEPEKFVASLRKRLEMGPTQIVELSSRRPAVMEWPLWYDRLGWVLLVAGVGLLLLLIGWLCFHFHSLPWVIALHFDANGTPDRLGPRWQIFILPLIGLLTWLFNGILGGIFYRQKQERVISYVLWGGAVWVQLLAWVAAVGLIGIGN